MGGRGKKRHGRLAGVMAAAMAVTLTMGAYSALGATVGNPGATTIDLVPMTISTAYWQFELLLSSPAATTVNANGNFTILESNLNFETIEDELPVIDFPEFVPFSFVPDATNNWSGNVDPQTGEMTLNGSLRLLVTAPALGATNCPVGPISLNLATDGSFDYDEGDGQAYLLDDTFTVDSTPNNACGGATASDYVDDLIGIVVPTEPGDWYVDTYIQFDPAPTIGTPTTTTTTPPTTPPTAPPTAPPTTPPTAPPTTAPPVVVATPSGYWMVDRTGHVYAFGAAPQLGNAPTTNAVDLEPTPTGRGYWVIDEAGHVFAFGDATNLGAPTGLNSGEIVTSLSRTPTGAGYWIFTNRGRVFAFGNARHFGDLSNVKLNGPVLDSIPTASGNGYFMVASDGGVFAFGDAKFFGSMGGKRLNAAVMSLVPDSDGTGYWLVALDGGIFAFDAPFRGSMGSAKLNRPVTGMVRYGNGYLMVGEDGGIFNFSDKAFVGSLGSNPPKDPIVSVAGLG